MSFFVGSGMGPAMLTPVRSEISLICEHTESTLAGSVPVREMRAFALAMSVLRRRLRGLAGLDVDGDADRHGLAHVADGEAAQGREVGGLLDDRSEERRVGEE